MTYGLEKKRLKHRVLSHRKFREVRRCGFEICERTQKTYTHVYISYRYTITRSSHRRRRRSNNNLELKVCMETGKPIGMGGDFELLMGVALEKGTMTWECEWLIFVCQKIR